MAVVSSVPAVERIRYPDISGYMAGGGGEIVEEEPVARIIDDIIYVAVGKDVKDSKSTLIWAVRNSGGKKICILHVHQPAQMIPMMGGKFPASSMKEQEVRAYREIERQNMKKILDVYLRICHQMGVRAEQLHNEMDCIEKGIVELISQRGIRKLVMGAAADKHHSRKMMDLRSKKAIYVCQQAPVSCQIQFICKGHLIHPREGNSDGVDTQAALLRPSPNTDTEQSPHHFRSQCVILGQNNRVKPTNPAQNLFRRVRSVNTEKYGGSPIDATSTDGTEGLSTPTSRYEAGATPDEWDRVSRRSLSAYSSSCSAEVGDLAVIQYERVEGSEIGSSDSRSLSLFKEDINHSSPPSVLDGNIDDTLYDHLEQAMAEAENAKREAFQEAVRRGKAEKDAIDAIRRMCG